MPNKVNPSLILASQSPRRKELLEAAGYTFVVDAPADSVEQGICSKCSPAELVLKAAFAKAAAISDRHEAGIVLAADTVAVCGSETLGKPENRDHAERMLRLMSGKQHRVFTGVCVRLAGTRLYVAELEQTILRMDELSDQQLEDYLETDQWIGKAGAFGYQDGLDWVHVETGLESNVVGLPVEKLDGWIEEVQLQTGDTVKGFAEMKRGTISEEEFVVSFLDSVPPKNAVDFFAKQPEECRDGILAILGGKPVEAWPRFRHVGAGGKYPFSLYDEDVMAMQRSQVAQLILDSR